MAKQSISRKETQVAMGDSIGKQLEQTVSVDDNMLPSPAELEAYQRIDPKIVEYLITSSQKEQEHRHKMDEEKLSIVKYSERKNGRMNFWGMFFAFFSLLVIISLSAYALYLDRPWFAGIFGFTAVAGILSIFVNAGKPSKDHKEENT